MPRATKKKAASELTPAQSSTTVSINDGQPATVVIATVGATPIVGPDLTGRTALVRSQLSVFEQYKNLITSEAEKFFIDSELKKVIGMRKAAEGELKKITDPLVESRRQALAAKQAAENLFAAFFNLCGQGETVLKGELLRWEQQQERIRLEAERVARAAAEAESRRILEGARVEAETAARAHAVEQLRIAELAQGGHTAEAEALQVEADARLEVVGESVAAKEEMADYTATQVFVPSTTTKIAGTSFPKTWKAHFTDLRELLAGIVDGTTPLESAVRAKVDGKLVAITPSLDPATVQSLEISLTFFNDRARAMEKNFSYRGVAAEFTQGVRASGV